MRRISIPVLACVLLPASLAVSSAWASGVGTPCDMEKFVSLLAAGAPPTELVIAHATISGFGVLTGAALAYGFAKAGSVLSLLHGWLLAGLLAVAALGMWGHYWQRQPITPAQSLTTVAVKKLPCKHYQSPEAASIRDQTYIRKFPGSFSASTFWTLGLIVVLRLLIRAGAK